MDYQQTLKEAIELKRKRKLSEALPIFQELMSIRPKDAYLLSNFSHLHFLIGNYKQALIFLEIASQISPLHPFMREIKVESLLRLKRIQEAEEFLKDRAKEADLWAIKKLVRVYIDQGRLDSALSQLKSSLSRIGYERDLSITQAEVLIKIGKKDEASECLKDVIKNDPKDEFAYARLIKLKLEEKNALEIIEELKPLLLIPSKADNASLRTLLASAYKEAGRFEDALNEYQTALKLNPDNLFIRKQLGFCLCRMRDDDGVISVMKECFISEPEDQYVFNTICSAYRKTSRLNELIELLSEVIARYPHKKKLWGLKKKVEKLLEQDN